MLELFTHLMTKSLVFFPTGAWVRSEMRTIFDDGTHSFGADVEEEFFPQFGLSSQLSFLTESHNLTVLHITCRRHFLFHIPAIVPLRSHCLSNSLFLTYWQTSTAHSESLFSANVSHSRLKHSISSPLWCHFFCMFPPDNPDTYPSDFLFPSFILFLATSSPVKEERAPIIIPFIHRNI